LEDILGESIGNRRARPLDQPRLKKRREVEQREVEAGLSPNNEDFAVSDRTEGGVTEAALNTNTPEGGHGTRTPRGATPSSDAIEGDHHRSKSEGRYVDIQRSKKRAAEASHLEGFGNPKKRQVPHGQAPKEVT